MGRPKHTDRVDLQVSVLTFLLVVVSSFSVFYLTYRLTYDAMIDSLINRAKSIHSFVETIITKDTLAHINTMDDMDSPLYMDTKKMLESVRESTDVRYLYTAKQTEGGDYIYLVDGLPSDSDDFRYPGDLLEPEIIPDIEKALKGELVLPDEIVDTSWGHIFISYFPIHEGDQVIGAVGIEFDARKFYETYRVLKILIPSIIVLFCCMASLIAVRLFRRISNPAYRDFANTDMLTGLANRNAFDVALHNLEMKKRQKGIGFISIDLDGLKLINDTLGHQAGDDYIKRGVRIIEKEISKKDILYRIGGDEFAVVSRSIDLLMLKGLAEQIENSLEAYNRTAELKVSFSIGYAVFNSKKDNSLPEALKRADEMMYQAKRKKKGTVVL